MISKQVNKIGQRNKVKVKSNKVSKLENKHLFLKII